jgi:5-dehydro-2-deoxygluconokinase
LASTGAGSIAVDLGRLSQNRFLVLGRAGMDFYAEPPGTRMEEARAFVAHLGGSAANIAVALARLGAGAGLVSRLSDDTVGRFCRAELARYGVGATHVGKAGAGLRTSLAVVETRSEDCQSVIYRNGAADLDLTPEDVAALDFAGIGALVVTGTALAGESSAGAVMAALAAARKAGVITVMDVDYRPYSWPSIAQAREVNLAAARVCDIVVGNDLEFDLLAGPAGNGLAMARALVAEGVAIAVYKRGEKGAVTVSAGGEFSTGIYRTAALKPTGAGDAFMGGFLAGLAAGLPLRRAVLQGSAAAAIVVSRVGCAPASPTPAELAAFLAGRPDPDPDPL